MFYPIGKCYKIEAFYKETFLITITRARGLMIKIGRLCLVITENENGFVYLPRIIVVFSEKTQNSLSYVSIV